METLKIVGLCILSAVLYGILHDQVTTRICVEYFTIGHPPIGTDSPTLLAFGWGIIATWWMGLILGVPLALIARLGTRPKLKARDLVRPIAILLLVMASLSVLAGVAGYFAARAGAVQLFGQMADRLPPDRHVPFLTDLWAHQAAYASGFVGGLVVWAWTWRERGRKLNEKQDLGDGVS